MEVNSQDSVAEEIPPGMIYPPPSEKEDFQITRDELDQLKQALKNEKFRSMLSDYAEEVQDPKNRTLFQSELRELEKQNGNVVHFINPIAGYVLKTSVNGEKKAFINMCSNHMIRKLSFEKATQDKIDGTICSIPFTQSPVREDLDKGGRYCDVFDVVFHPNTLALCNVDERIRQQVEATALDAIENSFNLKLDRNNIRRPKLKYKGMKNATMIKYPAGGSVPKVLDPEQIRNEPPPQAQESYYRKKENPVTTEKSSNSRNKSQVKKPPASECVDIENEKPTKEKSKTIEWTEPKYSLKYRSHVDLQDFCLDSQRQGRSTKPVPEEIVLTVDLPLLKDSSTLEADVLEGGWDFELIAERRAHYRLNLKLPFQVHCDQSKASFDVDKRKLVVIMKTLQKSKSKTDPTPVLLETSEKAKPLQQLEINVSQRSEGDYKVDQVSSESESSLDSPSPPPPERGPEGNFLKKATNEKKETCEELSQPESVPKWINGDIVVKSILKRSARSRSMSESWLDDRSPSEEDFMSLESLNENEEVVLGTSPSTNKSVRFSEAIQRQLYRSNSSIFGQRKKNQRKSRNKRKARGRLSSEGSVSSMDEEDFVAFTQQADSHDGGDSAVCDCESDEKDAKLGD